MAICHNHTGVSIFIKSDSTEPITLNMSTSDTVLDVKTKICDLRGIPPQEQKLIFAGKELNDAIPLDRYGVFSGSTLNLRKGMIITTCRKKIIVTMYTIIEWW